MNAPPVIPPNPSQSRRLPQMTGLSGNEIYCLHLKGMKPGNLVIGNSVYSLGLLGSIGAGFSNIIGGEVTQVTQVIHEGRLESYRRMEKEAQSHGGLGITGVTSELRHFHGNIEFLSVGSTVHGETGPGTGNEQLSFTTAHDAEELYCQLDAEYRPLKFVFGNVAYSVGLPGGVLGSLKSLARGEVREFSNVFNVTRHLALQRVTAEAASAGANAVVGIKTIVLPFQGIHEMMMMGTAAHNPALPTGQPLVTSDLTCQEMWNLAAMGYAPVKLVLGTAVYSLGVMGGVMAALKSFSRGEISELTTLIYDAREHAIGLIRDEAAALGADDVVGIKTHVHDLASSSNSWPSAPPSKKSPASRPNPHPCRPRRSSWTKTPGSPTTRCSFKLRRDPNWTRRTCGSSRRREEANPQTFDTPHPPAQPKHSTALLQNGQLPFTLWHKVIHKESYGQR